MDEGNLRYSARNIDKWSNVLNKVEIAHAGENKGSGVFWRNYKLKREIIA